jgi:hypothetical protein
MLQISKHTIDVCKDGLVSLDELVYMYCLFTNEDWGVDISLTSHMKLTRLGLLKDEHLSEDGLMFLSLALGEETIKEEIPLQRFEEFWKLYPYSDKQLGFPFSRVIRADKPGTKRLYTEAVLMGVTEDALIAAIEKEVEQRTTSTERFKGNPFKYMKSPLRWLTDKDYLHLQIVGEVVFVYMLISTTLIVVMVH